MDKTNFRNLHAMIIKAESIAISMHVRPDGDCIGTAEALRLALVDMGKKVDVFTDGQIPSHFSYLDGIKKFRQCKVDEWCSSCAAGSKKSKAKYLYDLMIIIDTGDEHRVGACQELKFRCRRVVVFDHHLNPTIDADLIVSNPTRASVGEMMFEYFRKHKINITKPMAEALYTAVSSDTGCFLFPNTTAYTHEVASELLNIGIDVANINYSNFRVYDPKTLKGLMEVLRRIQFINKGKIAITYLDRKLVKKYDFNHDERHRFQRYASDASGVMVSIFLTEQTRDSFNVSLRSHGDVNVASVAADLGGGGHKNASGLTMEGKYKDVIKKIVERVEKELKLTKSQ
ncbi:MAG: bifunctional oligoribonuclease/PAP phosphatase NrnA [Firmicutes bacterium]|nr:bifunctional oligoribonuclease/PAP phosphatase NrnA [Bacillota bacterium]